MQKSDRKVILFLISLALIALCAIYFVGNQNQYTALSQPDSTRIASLQNPINANETQHSVHYALQDGKRITLFPFDPNTADSNALSKLGLAPYQIRSIYKYRAKGGIYRTPQDFAKLYGLTRKQYRTLEPYIEIGDDYLPAFTMATIQAYEQNKRAEKQRIHEAYEAYKASDTYTPYKKTDRDTVRYPIKIKVGEHINLATADTALLKKVPGIGSGWARAIVNYGKRLGGYVAVGQLKEIEEFPVEALPFFEVRGEHTQKLNLNTLSISQLRRHPYINFHMAQQIVAYRHTRGKLTSLSQLRLLKDFPPEVIQRLQPYVTF